MQHQTYLRLLINKGDNLQEFWHQIIQKHEHFILNHLLKYIYWARFSDFIKCCLRETINKQTHRVVLYLWSGPGSLDHICICYNFVSTHVDTDMYPPTQNITKVRPCARFIYFPKNPLYELHICIGIMMICQLELEIWPKMAQNKYINRGT